MDKQEIITLIWFIIGLGLIIYSTANESKENFSSVLSKQQLDHLMEKTNNFYKHEYSEMVKQKLSPLKEQPVTYRDLPNKFSFEPRRADANLEPFSLPPKKSYSIDNYTFNMN